MSKKGDGAGSEQTCSILESLLGTLGILAH